MSFTPRWTAKLAKPLLNQIIALIQRDQTAAIAALAAAGIVSASLKPISEFHKARMARVAFPWLLVWISSNAMELEQDFTRGQDIDAFVAVEAGYLDQENAQEAAHDYVALLDSILETADRNADFEAPLPVKLKGQTFTTTPPTAGTVKRAQVVGHRVDAIMVEGYANPAVRGTVQVKFHLEEV